MKYNPQVVTAYYTQQGLPEPVYEYKFHQVRRWRFDIAFPDHKVALEVQGGIWSGGRHSRGKGMLGDMEKMNSAHLSGWRILYCVPASVCMLETINLIKGVIEVQKSQGVKGA